MQVPDDHGMLWHNLRRLGGVEWPRIWVSESGGLPWNPQVCRYNFAILGQDWFFRRTLFIESLLDLLQRELALDPETWRAQRQFLREFIGGFFQGSVQPAWIKIDAVRVGFSRRTAALRMRPLHRGSLDPDECVTMREFRGSGFDLDEAALPNHDFRLFHPVVPQEQLKLQRIGVLRTLKVPNQPRLLYSSEERIVAIRDGGDPEDVAMARNGITPALELSRDASDVQCSPLVSLSRLDQRGRTLHRCFSLRPRSGEIIDFRAVTYAPEYYFRSDMTTHTMLTDLTTPGAYDLF